MHGTVEVHYLFSEAPEELYALPKHDFGWKEKGLPDEQSSILFLQDKIGVPTA